MKTRHLVSITLLSLLVAAPALAAPGATQFVESVTDGVGGVDGLAKAQAVAVSPDGASVYVASLDDDAVAVFSRDAATQRVTFVEAEKDGVGGVDGLNQARDVVVSPDGKSVYAAGETDSAIAVFSRDPATGALTFVEREKDGLGGVDGLGGTRGLTISPDGKAVYAVGTSDDAVAAFSRDPATGALTFVEREKDGLGGVDGLDGALEVTVAPGGGHVYAVGSIDGAVVTFARDQSTGALTFVELDRDGVGGVDGIDDASDVEATPDGAFVYVAGSTDDSIATFARDSASGALTYRGQVQNGVDGAANLDAPLDLAIAPDGAHVYSVQLLSDSLISFARNPTTGALTPQDVEVDGEAGVTGIDSANGLDVSADGRAVYVASNGTGALTSFAIERDTTAPALALTGKGKQRLGGKLKLVVSCGAEPCSVEVTGALRAGHAKADLAPASADLAAGESRPVALKLSGKAKRKAKRALRDHRKASVRVNAAATDAAANAAEDSLKVRLRLR